MLVDADGISVGESKQVGDTVGIKKVIDVNATAHISRLLSYADTSDPCARIRT